MKKQILQRLEIIAKQLLNDQQSWKTEEIKAQVLELYNELVFLEHLEKLINHKPIPGSNESTDVAEQKEIPSIKKEESAENTLIEVKDEASPIDFSALNELSSSESIDESDPTKDLFETEEVEPTSEDFLDKKERSTQNPPVQNELELFAASFQAMPEFERKDIVESRVKSNDATETESKEQVPNKPKSLNDVINKGLNIGLNDRLAFIKHLFEGRSEDYTRVLSQLETFENLEEAMDFLNMTVKPDYNHWESKEDYVVRFVSIIEKRFS